MVCLCFVDDSIPIVIAIDALPCQATQYTIENFGGDKVENVFRHASEHEQGEQQPVVQVDPVAAERDHNGPDFAWQSLFFPPSIFGDDETENQIHYRNVADGYAGNQASRGDEVFHDTTMIMGIMVNLPQ